jgi:hypothetical protein
MREEVSVVLLVLYGDGSHLSPVRKGSEFDSQVELVNEIIIIKCPLCGQGAPARFDGPVYLESVIATVLCYADGEQRTRVRFVDLEKS